MKRKLIKKLTSVLSMALVFTMLLGVGSVFAEEAETDMTIDQYLHYITTQYSSQLDLEILTDVLDGYKCSTEFRKYYIDNPKEGRLIIDRAVKQHVYVKSAPKAGARAIYTTISAKAFPQKNGYYCGPAAVLQGRVANGLWDTNITEKEGYDLQDQFADIMSTDSTGTAQVEIQGALNMAYLWNLPYNVKWVGAGASNASLTPLIDESLRNGYSVVAHVTTDQLKYYEGYKTTHFVTLYKTDTSAKSYGIIDSNVNNGRKYFGLKSASVTELCNAMRKSGGKSTYTYADNFGDHGYRLMNK